MWKESDDFWLKLPDNKDENALLVALGLQPLRITASYDDENGKEVSREGHIDIMIVSFDRKSHLLRGNVVSNETGHNLSLRTLMITTSELADAGLCQIEEIIGIIF